VDILRKGKWNPMKAGATQSQEAAETLAIQALAFILLAVRSTAWARY
jgi:hypothetical protein